MSTPTRAYRSELRDAQAAQTRARVLDAAAHEFARHGYAGTTLAAIARGAGVSVETVKLQGAKHALLLGAFEVAFSGRESREQIMADAGMRAMLAALPEGQIVRALARFVADMNGRAVGVWLAFTGAAPSDPAVRSALDDLLERRRADYELVVDELAAHGLLRSERPRAALAAELSFLCSPEGYQQLVVESGWTAESYRDWLGRAIERLVLAP